MDGCVPWAWRFYPSRKCSRWKPRGPGLLREGTGSWDSTRTNPKSRLLCCGLSAPFWVGGCCSPINKDFLPDKHLPKSVVKESVKCHQLGCNVLPVVNRFCRKGSNLKLCPFLSKLKHHKCGWLHQSLLYIEFALHSLSSLHILSSAESMALKRFVLM